MRARTHGAALVAAIGLVAAVAPAGFANGDYGPDTCLNGYVWRAAVVTDHVCVTPAIRDQTAADNRQAAARHSPGVGPFGPDTCVQGFVWREAFADDHVCVTPATRSQATADNAAAASRRAFPTLRISQYMIPSPPCDGEACSTTNDVPRYAVQADHVNVGQVRLFLRRLNGTRIKSWTITTTPNHGAPGARILFRSGRPVCGGSTDSYFQLQDLASGRLSPRRYVRADCATL